MTDERGPDGFCCGTCELAELTSQGKVRFEPSPHLLVGDDEFVAVVHEVSGIAVVRRVALRRGDRVVIGRSPDVDIVIQSKFADRRIFALEVTATGAVFAEDVGSACGTLVNGKRIARRRLNRRDVINVASNTFITFQQGEECGRPTQIELACAPADGATVAPGSADSAPLREATAAAPASPAPADTTSPRGRPGIWRWLQAQFREFAR